MNTGEDFLERFNQELVRLKISPTSLLLGVSISQQRCFFFKNNRCVMSYAVSTSRNPPSEAENSFGTPRGLHEIAEKIGAGEPEGMVFRGRVATGRCYFELPEAEQEPNLITSRILRLRGLEPGRNAGPGVDSYDRYIYFHGTNHEDRIGKPFSGGCIEFSNASICELFEQIPERTLVWIEG